MGDDIMALFGAPVAHEDHAVRACYAALRMLDAVGRYSDELRRVQGVEAQIRVGVNSVDVVVRSIGSDLRMDYTAVGQTTHLVARMEQLASPGSILLTARTLHLAESYVDINPLGPVPIKGLASQAAKRGIYLADACVARSPVDCEWQAWASMLVFAADAGKRAGPRPARFRSTSGAVMTWIR
jgi:class 3 adenylate cyclase